jgi:hypothetical protein
VNDTAFKIQKITLTVEKATNGFFISNDNIHIGFTYDVDAIKYLCSKLLDVDVNDIELQIDVVDRFSSISQVKQIKADTLDHEAEQSEVDEKIKPEENKIESASFMDVSRPGSEPNISGASVMSSIRNLLTPDNKDPEGDSIDRFGYFQQDKLVSILDGNPNYYPRPWEKDQPTKPVERGVRTRSQIPVRSKDSDIKIPCESTATVDGEKKSDSSGNSSKNDSFAERVALCMQNDFDTSTVQPLTHEEDQASATFDAQLISQVRENNSKKVGCVNE